LAPAAGDELGNLRVTLTRQHPLLQAQRPAEASFSEHWFNLAKSNLPMKTLEPA
jgi:hypothetical protein